MSTTPYVVDRFGGLDLLNDPEEVGAASAIDLLNVRVNRRGRVVARDGYSDQTSGLAPTADRYLILVPVGKDALIAIGPNGSTVNYDDVTIASSPAFANRGTGPDIPLSWATLGTGLNAFTFVAFGIGGATIKKLSFGSAVASGTGKGGYVGVLPLENRLAQAGFLNAADTPSGADGTPSTVFFSDAKAPDTYTATSWVQLQPGDGESIMAVGSWQNYLFVFKRTTMFVFYSTSVSGTGQPIFNYRRVPLSDPFSYSDVQPVAGPDGLYFVTAGGIFRTDGGAPVNVSSAVMPVFDRSAADTLAMGNRELLTFTFAPTLSWIGQRLIFNYYTAAGAQRQLVWERATGQWTVWDLPSRSNFVQVPQGSVDNERGDEMMFGGEASSVAHVYEMGPSFTTDNGAAVAWSYTSGAYDISGQNRKAITLESSVWGSGVTTLQVANDHGSFDTGSALTLGAAPAVAQAWQEIDREGTFWQHKLSGSGPASISRLAHYVSFVKPVGME